jgi:simple sugar transport system permease protein
VSARLRALAGRLLAPLLPLVLALAFIGVLLLLVGAPPGTTLLRILDGALGRSAAYPYGRPERLAIVLANWVPITLAAAGLLITFAAGLWNIGVEGQVIFGAIGATAVIRALGPDVPVAVMLPALLAGGLAGGLLWGLLAAVIRVYGRVHEIFVGLGLNFVAAGLTIYLIFGPWRQPRGGTMSGTEVFPPNAWLPVLGRLEVSPIALVLAVLAVSALAVLLGNTLWGLQLRAIGRNPAAAVRLGIPAERALLLAFAACGALAGLAGAIQAAGYRHTLFPGVSSNYGYLAILVVLLAGFRPLAVAPIALFFAAVSIGSTQLYQLGLDTSLGGVLQGALVLSVLLVAGARRRLAQRALAERAREAPPDGA